MPASPPTIDDAMAVLADRPRDEEDLFTALGLSPDDDDAWQFLEDVEDDGRIIDLTDGRMAVATALLEGVTAWHRVGEDEVAARMLAPGIDGILHLAVGPWPHEVRVGDEVVALGIWTDAKGPDLDRGPSLRLPDGWAVDLTAGDLVALVLDGDQTRLVTADDPRAAQAPGRDPNVGGRLRAAFSAVAHEHAEVLTLLHDPDEPLVDQWVLHLDDAAPLLLADHGEILQALDLPLGEAVSESGLTCVNGVVGGPAVSTAHLGLYSMGDALLRSRRDLTEDRAEVAEAAGLAWGVLVGQGRFDDEVRSSVDAALLRALEVPGAVDALVDHLRLVDDDLLDGMSVRAGEAHGLDPEAPGPAWLAAETLIARGQPGPALEVLSATMGAGKGGDPPEEWRGAWEALANLRAVAGDINGAVALFDRMGEIGVVRRLSQWRSTAPRGVGRNERCPCGSGRKFKQCCLIHPLPLDLDSRVGYLWWKLETWAVRYHGDHAPRPDVDPSGPSMIAVWMLGYDAHIVEDGAMAEVVAEIGDLLPPDERALVDRWATRGHSLWEVGAVATNGSRRLRDLLHGVDVHVDGAPLEDASTGDLLLALVVPGAEGEHLVGHVVGVATDARERALQVLADDPDGQDIVDLAADLVRPSSMTTPDGDPLVVHGGRWQVADLDEAVAALDLASPRSYEELEWPDGEDADSVRWSLRVEDDELIGGALSDQRWDELEALVNEVLPDATLVDRHSTEASALLEAARQFEGSTPSSPAEASGDAIDFDDDVDLDDDDAMVQHFVRQKEVEWCDQPVPALGGITPRQALADPSRRDDVIALVRSFRTPVTPTLAGRGFDGDRIAALLGIADEL